MIGRLLCWLGRHDEVVMCSTDWEPADWDRPIMDIGFDIVCARCDVRLYL